MDIDGLKIKHPKSGLFAEFGPTAPDGQMTVTVHTVAKLLGISRNSAYDAVHRGEIPSLRFGRRIVVPLTALAQLLEKPES
jgi:excisionase family DNA binding protein